MVSSPIHRSLPEDILVWFLEVLGAVTAILFGVFGAMSWKAASEANQKSDIANDRSDAANLVALVALCAQLTTGDDAQHPLMALCNGIQAVAEPQISSIASSIFGHITPTTTTSISTTSTSSSASSESTTGTSSMTTTSTSTTGITTSDGGASFPTSSAQPGSSSSPSVNNALVLGLGIGLGSVVVFISAMTVWALVKKRKIPPEIPPKDQ